MAFRITRSIPGLLRPLTLLRHGCSVSCRPCGPSLACRFSTLTLATGPQRPAFVGPAPLATLPNHSLPRSGILYSAARLSPSLLEQPARSLTYYSLKKGKRKTVKAVVKRFLRLHCGLWLRRKAGYKKKLWKKKSVRKKRLREHVFCNATQSRMLNKMTTSFWKRRNWYIDDPHQKYHDRTNLKL
ncbi:39S ribosomal protein L35, mitochondrial [Brienomyrus brachyistius]|uniref:39S ribosomal protein L35, mitochondrial n=1 Tax=Brienomyrus brachyistius TaxID=42636 RepID=UPI0020B289BA|nr:39S ribosomal protein L35, mitochondrial [Brienomyrus brachyistius]